MMVLIPNADGLMMAGGGNPGNESALNMARVAKHGRSGSGLAGTSRGRVHPRAAKAALPPMELEFP